MLASTILPSIKIWQKYLLDAVFPWKCLCCKKLAENAVCEKCLAGFSPAKQKCIECFKPSLFGLTHPSCKTPSGLEGVFAAFDYKTGGFDKALIGGKYHFLPEVFPLLSKKAWENFLDSGLQKNMEGTFITPIPLSKRRLAWRGFNQTEMCAKEISKLSTWEIKHLLQRRHTKDTQKSLDKEHREKNIKGVFELKKSKTPWHAFLFEGYPTPPQVDIKDKTILLVDDVATTGSTLKEACKILKHSGAKEVWGFVLASE